MIIKIVADECQNSCNSNNYFQHALFCIIYLISLQLWQKALIIASFTIFPIQLQCHLVVGEHTLLVGGQVKPLNAVQEEQAVIDRPLCGILTLLRDLHKVMAATLPWSNYALMAFSATRQKRRSCALFLIRISVLLTQGAPSHLYSAERRVEVAG